MNIYKYTLSRCFKEDMCGHKSFVIWLTGLPSSGKSTVADDLEIELHKRNVRTVILDGDNLRTTVNKDLGFTKEDRTENLRRAGEIAQLFVGAGVVVICAFVSPFEKDREMVRKMFKEDEFIEVFVSCGIETCRSRDTKGVYKDFVGDITKKYEVPENANLRINTETTHYRDCTKNIIDYLDALGMLPKH